MVNAALTPAVRRYLKALKYYNPAHPASFDGASKIRKFIQSDGKHELSKHQITNGSDTTYLRLLFG